jgi:hypothetical protein
MAADDGSIKMKTAGSGVGSKFAYMEYYDSRKILPRNVLHFIVDAATNQPEEEQQHEKNNPPPPPSLLMFGSGYDSRLLCAAIAGVGGAAVFIEAEAQWIDILRTNLIDVVATVAAHNGGSCTAYHVGFGTTTVADSLSMLEANLPPNSLMPDLPPELHLSQWDVVVVDGPGGFADTSPGRMKSIYAASVLVKPAGTVVVDDYDRAVERAWADRYLSDHGTPHALFGTYAPTTVGVFRGGGGGES